MPALFCGQDVREVADEQTVAAAKKIENVLIHRLELEFGAVGVTGDAASVVVVERLIDELIARFADGSHVDPGIGNYGRVVRKKEGLAANRNRRPRGAEISRAEATRAEARCPLLRRVGRWRCRGTCASVPEILAAEMVPAGNAFTAGSYSWRTVPETPFCKT